MCVVSKKARPLGFSIWKQLKNMCEIHSNLSDRKKLTLGRQKLQKMSFLSISGDTKVAKVVTKVAHFFERPSLGKLFLSKHENVYHTKSVILWPRDTHFWQNVTFRFLTNCWFWHFYDFVHFWHVRKSNCVLCRGHTFARPSVACFAIENK